MSLKQLITYLITSSSTRDSQNTLYYMENINNTLKHDLCRTLGGRDVVPEECTVRTVLLLFDSHRELFQSLVVKSAFPEYTRKFPSECPLVVLAREKRHRFAGLATTACTNITISVRSPERRKAQQTASCTMKRL